jgi:hypothetical protein
MELTLQTNSSRWETGSHQAPPGWHSPYKLHFLVTAPAAQGPARSLMLPLCWDTTLSSPGSATIATSRAGLLTFLAGGTLERNPHLPPMNPGSPPESLPERGQWTIDRTLTPTRQPVAMCRGPTAWQCSPTEQFTSSFAVEGTVGS